ncbi:MAG TPA: glycosyltransferase [Elainellaceae cyanobacterium]
MKILILTVGSRGDVQPFIALGIGLNQAGHDVSICTSSSFKDFIIEHGLSYADMNDDFVELATGDAGRAAMESANTLIGWIKTAIELNQRLKPLQRRMLRDEWDAAHGIDVIVYHPKAMGGTHIAEKLGIPEFAAVPVPLLVPTQDFPSPVFPNLNVGGWYNRLTYRLINWLTLSYKGLINQWRDEVLNLPPASTAINRVKRPDGSLIPVLHGYSPHVVPEPEDWHEWAIATGYWFLNTSEDWQPPPDLVDFLNAGPPPVYVGFGSISGREPAKTAQIVIEALQQSGQRGILATGWGGLDASHLPDSIFKVDSVPHDWLFSHVSAVIHHGGAGTTAAGLRAGKPTIICPFFGDQPFWGRRVADLGVGPDPIPQKQLTSNRLAIAIQETITNSSIQQRAAQLGATIRREDGVTRAVELIHAYLERGNRTYPGD